MLHKNIDYICSLPKGGQILYSVRVYKIVIFISEDELRLKLRNCLYDVCFCIKTRSD